MKSNRIKKIIRTKSLFESVAMSSLEFELNQICKLHFRESIIITQIKSKNPHGSISNTF
jgi:hypothetical protein